jgi:hypothetical protein
MLELFYKPARNMLPMYISMRAKALGSLSECKTITTIRVSLNNAIVRLSRIRLHSHTHHHWSHTNAICSHLMLQRYYILYYKLLMRRYAKLIFIASIVQSR